ncbi:hypothetical protein MM326_02630 [Alkalihalobacillus sp. LMS6]|uniref:hypothetical protein n=1 Tax=Bacillaceae TaxID=186817 RepID=UPI001145E1EB|nr:MULTISPECIES: hypothetical protein [Bacillaceae]UTR06945.1 hypothetical protein MM326_02630 [Alkalihalobacillus sp. LMS6]
MPKKGSIFLFSVIIFPLVVTSLLTLYRFIAGREVGLEQFLSNFLGYAVGGLFVGFIWYNIKKLDQYDKR